MMIEDQEVKYVGIDDKKGSLENSGAEVFLRDFPYTAPTSEEKK